MNEIIIISALIVLIGLGIMTVREDLNYKK